MRNVILLVFPQDSKNIGGINEKHFAQPMKEGEAVIIRRDNGGMSSCNKPDPHNP
jgi:hypothetical protein